MTELDQWTEREILYPHGEAWLAFHEAPDEEAQEACKAQLTIVEADVKKAIREKVLESYHNGQNALRMRSRETSNQGNFPPAVRSTWT